MFYNQVENWPLSPNIFEWSCSTITICNVFKISVISELNFSSILFPFLLKKIRTMTWPWHYKWRGSWGLQDCSQIKYSIRYCVKSTIKKIWNVIQIYQDNRFKCWFILVSHYRNCFWIFTEWKVQRGFSSVFSQITFKYYRWNNLGTPHFEMGCFILKIFIDCSYS